MYKMVEEVKHISKRHSNKKENKHIRISDYSSKSIQLRLYEQVYNKYIKKIYRSDSVKSVDIKPHESDKSKSPPPIDLPRRKRATKPHESDKSKPIVKKKKLTCYQEFVKSESKKTKYKKFSPRSRLKSIGHAWREKKEGKSKVVTK